MDARGLNGQDPNGQEHLNVWEHQDVARLHRRDCVAHISVHQRDEFPAEYQCCLKPGNAAAGHAEYYTSAHFHQDHQQGAAVALYVSVALLTLRNCWLPGAADPVPLDYYYAYVGRSMNY